MKNKSEFKTIFEHVFTEAKVTNYKNVFFDIIHSDYHLYVTFYDESLIFTFLKFNENINIKKKAIDFAKNISNFQVFDKIEVFDSRKRGENMVLFRTLLDNKQLKKIARKDTINKILSFFKAK